MHAFKREADLSALAREVVADWSERAATAWNGVADDIRAKRRALLRCAAHLLDNALNSLAAPAARIESAYAGIARLQAGVFHQDDGVAST